MVIYTQNKISEIRSIAYLVMVEDGINYLNLSNQRAIPPLLLRISMYNHTMVIIYTQYKLHEIHSIAY